MAEEMLLEDVSEKFFHIRLKQQFLHMTKTTSTR